MGRPLCEVQYDFELDQFATHEAEHFRTFPEFSRQWKESQDVRLLLGPTAPRQYPECRQESAQCQAHKSSSTGQHKPHTEDWTWSKAPTASKATPQDRRDSREHKGATSAQYQSELIVQQKLHRASKDVSSRQHHGKRDESPEHRSSRRLSENWGHWFLKAKMRYRFSSSDSSDSSSQDRQSSRSWHRSWSHRRLSTSPESDAFDHPTDRQRKRSPPMPKVESLDGKPNEWDSFIFHFRKIAHYHQWKLQRE